jgi:predicted ferric reductase
MTSSNARPKWWQLYLSLPLIVVLFVLDHQLNISTHAHQALQIGILVVVYGLIYRWLKANSMALSRMDQEQYYGRVTFVQIQPPLLHEDQAERHPMLQLPNSEVKGILGNTLEMGTSDAFPINQGPQKVNKE